MKLTKCLLLMALVLVVAGTAINCVQDNTTTPRPSPGATPTPGLTPTPTPEPAPTEELTWDRQSAIYNIAIHDPYVNQSIIKTAWRNTYQEGNQLKVNVSTMMGGVWYMACHEIGPDYDRTRVLPAAVIIPGNASLAGIDVISFVDSGRNRVAYIGFVPRPGIPISNVTFTAFDAGVDEYNSAQDSHRYYNNATVIDTGYTRGMSLPKEQIDQATAMAMANATVRNLIGGHSATMQETSVKSYETGYPYRYILAYPVVTIDVFDGITQYDTVYAFTDLINSRVVRVEHGELFLF